MHNYRISLLYHTYRPGGLDLLCNSLKTQTYDNWELSIVDDYEPRCHGTEVKDYFEDAGIPLVYHGPSKKKCYPDTPFGQANAMNTGLLQASGDIAVIVEDYIWITPKSLEKWNRRYNDLGLSFFITSVGIEWTYKKPDRIGDITVWDEAFTGDFSKCTVAQLWIPGIHRNRTHWETEKTWGWEWDWHYSAGPMSAWEAINGVDERYDYWRLYPSMFFPSQVKAHGYRFYPDAGHLIYMIDHREWDYSNPFWHVDRICEDNPRRLTHIYKYSPNCFDLGVDRRRV